MQIRRSLRLSVCAFYILVEALYTLKHHSAESVTSDFFIADPIILLVSALSFQRATRNGCKRQTDRRTDSTITVCLSSSALGIMTDRQHDYSRERDRRQKFRPNQNVLIRVAEGIMGQR